MNANCEFGDQISQLSGGTPDSKQLLSRVVNMQKEPESSSAGATEDPNTSNQVSTDIASKAQVSDRQYQLNQLQQPVNEIKTHRTTKNQNSSACNENSETNYSTGKKALTTFEELKQKYLKDADAVERSDYGNPIDRKEAKTDP